MNLKKVVISILSTIAIIAAIFTGINITNRTASAAMNDLAKQNKYVGVTYLYKMLAVNNIEYNKFYTKNKIVYRNHGEPEGIVIHETADPGATAANEAIYFNREWNKMYAYVHAFVDHKQVIQMMTPNYGVWGAGPMANDRFVQVELCEENNRNDFAKSINNDAIWSAQILHRYHLKPTNATHNGKGTVWSHAAVSKFLGGTDHGDPVGYFAKWGYNMDQFFDLIKYYYDLQDAKPKKPVKVKKESSSKNVVQTPTKKDGQKILMHDAYVYNNKGRRIRNKATLKAGIPVDILNTKTINKSKYYHIGKNQYVVASNIDGRLRKLSHNSYIYNTVGTSDGKTKLMKNSSVRTYGGQIKIAGIKYYAISPTQFVKAQNF